jgi:transposase
MDLTKAHLHCRVSTYKGTTYKSYSLARAIRQDGKNRREILLKLGKLTDEEANQLKATLKALKGGHPMASLSDVVVEDQYAYLDVAVLLETWNSWGLSSVFAKNGERQIPLWMVVAILTINRCVDPSSKSQVSSWFQRTALPFLLNIDPSQINPSRIFRELTAIDTIKPELCDYLYQEVTKRDPASMESVFYDLSSTTFSGTKCILMKWGRCKEGYDNHMVLALVVNKKGLPVFWEVLSGGTADATTIDWLIRSLKSRFKFARPTMVFDRGMVSDDNLTLLEDDLIKYISAMDKNQIEALADLDFSSFCEAKAEEVEGKVLASGKFEQLNTSTYYHEVKLDEEGKRRYILCFNPQLCNDQKQARRQAIADFEMTVRRINHELLDAKKSRTEEATLKKFTEEMSPEQRGFLSIELTHKNVKRETVQGNPQKIRTYQGKMVVDQQKIVNAGRLDGFWMLVTNHMEKTQGGEFEMSAAELVQPYKDKVVIESAFRDIKSFLDISPVHVWTMEHVRAHYTICVLAYLLDRTLTLKLHENEGLCSENVVAHAALYEELGRCVLNRLTIKETAEEKASLTRPTEKQKDLLGRVGFKYLLSEVDLKRKLAKSLDYV